MTCFMSMSTHSMSADIKGKLSVIMWWFRNCIQSHQSLESSAKFCAHQEGNYAADASAHMKCICLVCLMEFFFELRCRENNLSSASHSLMQQWTQETKKQRTLIPGKSKKLFALNGLESAASCEWFEWAGNAISFNAQLAFSICAAFCRSIKIHSIKSCIMIH